MNTKNRGQWTRIGFILAASGSAIGLGNIVFFPGNAYRFGGGAFYLPYFIVLLVVGIPMLILELGLGSLQRSALPGSLAKAAGRRGEMAGWWTLLNTSVITLYYVTIVGWVIGMAFGSLGDLWRESFPVAGFTAESLPNPAGYYFHLLTSWWPLVFVVAVWLMNAWIVRRGTTTIERAVKLFVPAMWIFMAVLALRGLTLDGGVQGMWTLFTPDFAVMRDVAVWQGAFCQIFFTLSVGFGVMTAYASYLPPKSDQTSNAVVISSLNCGFEYLAGIGIFSILFANAVVPQASTLSMTFFIVPQGIAQLPGGTAMAMAFGLLFFVLMLFAGLSSSVSLVEALTSALVDKFAISRRQAIAVICTLGVAGSSAFALPAVVDPAIADDGTLGLTLLDLTDHWVFSYGLLIAGLLECLLLGWVFGVRRIREHVNESSAWRLGPWYDGLVRFVIPAGIVFVMGYSLWQEASGGIYGSSYVENFAPGWTWLSILPWGIPFLWLSATVGVAWLLTRTKASRTTVPAGLLREEMQHG